MLPVDQTQLEGGLVDADHVGQSFRAEVKVKSWVGRSNQTLQGNDLLFLACT